MNYDKVIEDFHHSFPKDFICRENMLKNGVILEGEGLFKSNLRTDDLKSALRCDTKIDINLLKGLLPVIEYTDLLLYYRRRYVEPLNTVKAFNRAENLQGAINKANDLIDIAKAMSNDESKKALESFRDLLVDRSNMKQLTENRIYDNFLFFASYMTVELTNGLTPTQKILNIVNMLLRRYFNTADEHTYKAGIKINNFMVMEFKYQTAESLPVRYSPKLAGK